MKTILLAAIAVAFSISAACADSAMSPRLSLVPASPTVDANGLSSMPSLALATGQQPTAVGESSRSNFAQINTTSNTLPLTMPISSGLVLTFVAVLVLTLRIVGLNHARAMADHERDSYRGKARMFRVMHEGGADH